MPLPTLRPASPRTTRVTTTTTGVLRRLDARVLRDVLAAAAPVVAEAPDVALLAESRDGERVSGEARVLLADGGPALLLVTPDASQPTWVTELAGAGRLVWCSSVHLADAVAGVLDATPGRRALTAHDRQLLTELLAYWEEHGLRRLDDVVVVAARTAWPEYLRTSAFVTSPGRTLRGGTTHLGFYREDAVADVVPAIEGHYANVRFTAAAAASHRERGREALAHVIEQSLAAGFRSEGSTHAVLLLTSPEHEGTVRLERQVADDATSTTGRRTAWTTSQRYTAVERLRRGSATSQL